MMITQPFCPFIDRRVFSVQLETILLIWFSPGREKIMKTTTDFNKMKQEGEKIVMLTAYDYPSGKLAEEAGVDVILVGDSLGMVVLGYNSTVAVTVEDMIHHGKATRRGAPDTFLIVDMPFGTYQGNYDRTLQQAVRVLQETGADALKLEGAGEVIAVTQELTNTGIPIVAHLGLLPQHAGVVGGYKVQGKTAAAAEQLLADAVASEGAGACMIVLECIPYQLAEKVSQAVSIPVIGIGAGAKTDGQVLVYHDVIQYGSHRIPKFVEKFADAGSLIQKGLEDYVEAVKKGVFPAAEHRFTMKEEELISLYGSRKGD